MRVRFTPAAWYPSWLFCISWWQYALVLLIFLLGTGHAQFLTAQVAISSLAALPRETISLALQLENTADAPWRGTPKLALPEGWRAVLSPGEVILKPGERYLALFTVLVSAGAEAGEYTLPVTSTGPAGTAFSASYMVRVKEVRKLETVLLEAPAYVIASPYTARFSVRNAGNRSETVVLHTRDSLSLPLTMKPAQLQLESGEIAEVTVTASVSPDLGMSQSHRLYLEASVPGSDETSSFISATVELIPRAISAASAYHQFPLELRLGETLSTESLAASDYLGGLDLSVSGTGQLWDEDPGTLDIQLGLESGEIDNNLVSYESPAFEVAAGQQSFSISPLTASRSGLGLDGQHDFTLGTTNKFEVRALAYHADDAEWVAGLHTTAAFGPLVEVGVYSLVSSGLYGTVIGGQFGLHPKFGGNSELSLETEYGFQLGTRAGGFRFGGKVWGDDVSLNATWQQTAAGYQGASEDSYSLDLSSSLYLDRASSTYASARFNQKESYQPGELLISRPEKFGRSWSGRVSTLVSGVGLSLKYEDSDGFDVTNLSARYKRELTFNVSAPLAADFLLTQEMSWLQEFNSIVKDELLGYEAGAIFALEGGSLTPRVGGEYSLLNNSLSKVSLGVDWFGLVTNTDSLILDLEGELELLGNRAVKLSTRGSYEFDNGQALDLDFSGRVHFDREPSLKLALGYDIPFDVPLSRLSNVGEVTGRFEDASGAGLSGLIVQVTGLSVITAEDGSFTFPAVPEGDHTLVVGDTGAMSDRITVPALPHSVHLNAGETVEANFRVIRPAAVQGQVRFVHTEGGDGTPQAGPGSDVILGAGQPEQDASLVANLVVELRKGESVLRARTDAEGNFEFRKLLPGPWQLTVVRGSLSELYRLEPEVQPLSIGPGTTARVEVELIPVARSIQFMDGGVLSTP